MPTNRIKINPYSFIDQRLPYRQEKPRILEVGAASGKFWQSTPENLRNNLTMIDIQPLSPQVRYGDVTGLEFKNGSFTHVVANYTLERTLDRDKALREISRVLEKGGTALFLSRHPDDKDLLKQVGFRPALAVKTIELLQTAERRKLKQKEKTELKKLVIGLTPEFGALMREVGKNKAGDYLARILIGQKTEFPEELKPFVNRANAFTELHFMNEDHIKKQLERAGLTATEVKLLEHVDDGTPRLTWGIVAKKK